MNIVKILSVVAVSGAVLFASIEAEAAKRVGGARSSGKQSQTVQKTETPTSSAGTPAQANPAAAKAGAPAAAPAAAAAAPARNKWLGPLAGLAAGLGLAALASHLGFGEGFGNIMMIVLFGLIAFAAFRFFMARRNAGNQSNQPNAFATATNYAGSARPVEVLQPAAAAPLAFTATQAVASNIPADFDTAGFVRNAKVYFLRLQAANDTGNQNDIREFTTPEMFGEISLDIQARKGAIQQTEVTTLDANVVAVQSNAFEHMASVRFTGQIREEVNGPTESFDEVWNMTKPIDGQGGWVLAGIQQIA